MTELAAPDITRLVEADLWPRQLEEMAGVVYGALTAPAQRMQPQTARLLAAAIVAALATHYGGVTFYVPKTDSILRAIRNLNIRAEYDGSPNGKHGIYSLARRYRLTPQAIWEVIRNTDHQHEKPNV